MYLNPQTDINLDLKLSSDQFAHKLEIKDI